MAFFKLTIFVVRAFWQPFSVAYTTTDFLRHLSFLFDFYVIASIVVRHHNWNPILKIHLTEFLFVWIDKHNNETSRSLKLKPNTRYLTFCLPLWICCSLIIVSVNIFHFFFFRFCVCLLNFCQCFGHFESDWISCGRCHSYRFICGVSVYHFMTQKYYLHKL